MDQTVLFEKRKNLLDSSKKSSELFLNSHYVDLTHLFSEPELLTFIENTGVTELKISKTDLVNKITTVINDANNSDNLTSALQSLHFNKTSNLANKEKLIQDIIDDKLQLIEELLEYSLKAKLEYFDTSV
jgi:hypothetical protein